MMQIQGGEGLPWDGMYNYALSTKSNVIINVHMEFSSANQVLNLLFNGGFEIGSITQRISLLQMPYQQTSALGKQIFLILSKHDDLYLFTFHTAPSDSDSGMYITLLHGIHYTRYYTFHSNGAVSIRSLSIYNRWTSTWRKRE